MKIKAELDLNIALEEQKRICIHYLESLLPGDSFEEYSIEYHNEEPFWFKTTKDGYGKIVGQEWYGRVTEVDKSIKTLLDVLKKERV